MMMPKPANKILDIYSRFGRIMSMGQSPFLLIVRLYWGWQFAQTGWGKLNNLPKITESLRL